MTKLPVWDGNSGMLGGEDIALIRELVRQIPTGQKPRLVVDLGAGSGTSALAVFTAGRDDIRVVSVDVRREALDNTRANMEQYGFLTRWQGLQGRSDRIAWSGDAMIDLLLCDSTHDYASQADELEKWLPYVWPKGLVWVHDYTDQSRYPGVSMAIDEAVKAGRLKKIETRGLSWAGRRV